MLKRIVRPWIDNAKGTSISLSETAETNRGVQEGAKWVS